MVRGNGVAGHGDAASMLGRQPAARMSVTSKSSGPPGFQTRRAGPGARPRVQTQPRCCSTDEKHGPRPERAGNLVCVQTPLLREALAGPGNPAHRAHYPRARLPLAGVGFPPWQALAAKLFPEKTLATSDFTLALERRGSAGPREQACVSSGRAAQSAIDTRALHGRATDTRFSSGLRASGLRTLARSRRPGPAPLAARLPGALRRQLVPGPLSHILRTRPDQAPPRDPESPSQPRKSARPQFPHL